ncbi:sigma-70 family RNA polymerase sigma factor [Oceanobacillus saliphilus]|uniref:sigma-70 family RNA polymerase sigma factor n=1 Tax=Oceanobacillus saliphilus TaxID=2925834 RepID=UPI00201D8142|nr:sigma-70 family RNA polymerase sigma factor [Oceanobacillus saliphilus]
MKDKEEMQFEEIFKQNERRIYYQMQRLGIYDPSREFYMEGLYAMWIAYKKYEPDKGPLATYFNYTIRNRLIDLLRKKSRTLQAEEKIREQSQTQLQDGNYIRKSHASYPIPNIPDILLDDPIQWRKIKSQLTENQWKWVNFYILGDISIKDIAIQENTTPEAVKSWGKQVRKKLKRKHGDGSFASLED